MSQAKPDIVVTSSSTEQTEQVGAVIARSCAAGDIVALQGELGAGKTQLVRGLADGLGVNPRQVSSPTFVMLQEYEPMGGSAHRPVLVHIDAYRIRSDDELASIGWHGHGEELRENAVVAVEWASLIEPALGADVLWVEIAHEPDGRSIFLSARGGWRDKMQLLSESLRDAGLTLTQGAEP